VDLLPLGNQKHELHLTDLVDVWRSVKAPRSPKTIERAQLCVSRFNDAVGKKNVLGITREDFLSYRQALEDLSLSPNNVQDHLNRLNAILNTAVSEGLLNANPGLRVKARGRSALVGSKRQGFTKIHLEQIFAMLPGQSQEFQWVLKLLAYHGMRSGEACQLRCDDISRQFGVPILRVHDLHGRVKNRPSIRDIPIHPLALGIVEFADSVSSNMGSGSPLFAAMPQKRGSRANWFQDYGSRFLRRKVGIIDPRYTLHSFRHLWRTLARECEMPESVSRSLMGHSLGAGEHGAYGTAPSLKLRAQWIAKIDLAQA
jgi:integrase